MGGMSTQESSRSQQGKEWILNRQLKETYEKQLRHLCFKKALSVGDRLQLVCYLLMQERRNEARKQFSKIREDQVAQEGEPRMQYDYIAAYFDF